MKTIILILAAIAPLLSFSQNVGVGTTTPAEKLDINGNMNITGTIKINGTDGTANQFLRKDNSGVLGWGNMLYPAAVSDTSINFLPQTARNLWVTDPGISVTVSETGTYLVFFYGSMFNNNQTFSYETSYDSDGIVRVFNSTTGGEVFNTVANTLYFDLYSPNDALRKYIPLRPSFAIAAGLSAGNVLQLQYRQSAFGSPFPTAAWYLGSGGITILKIGN